MAERGLIVGWDVGGVHVKAAARSAAAPTEAPPEAVVSVPFEIWRGPERLTSVLEAAMAELAARMGSEKPLIAGWDNREGAARIRMAVTMTAELSDAFPAKRVGVGHVLSAFEEAFPGADAVVLDSQGGFAPLAEARTRPLDFAATNWVAAAGWLARRADRGVLVDVGSTTTDLIPFAEGRLCNRGSTDLERLMSGELVYTGVLRTNPNTLAPAVPLRGGWCRTAAESFCCMGDVHLLLGRLGEGDYSVPAPDGRPPAAGAAARLARLVCADEEAMPREELLTLARYLAGRQVGLIADALSQVLSAPVPSGGLLTEVLGPHPVLFAAGSGAFVVGDVGREVRLEVRPAAPDWPEAVRRVLPAAAVGALCGADGR